MRASTKNRLLSCSCQKSGLVQSWIWGALIRHFSILVWFKWLKSVIFVRENGGALPRAHPFCSHQDHCCSFTILRDTPIFILQYPAVGYTMPYNAIVTARHPTVSPWNRHLLGGFNQPLWIMMEFVSWDDEIPNCFWKVINAIFQTTNQPFIAALRFNPQLINPIPRNGCPLGLKFWW